MKYHIIFRTCDIVLSLHNAPRPFNLDKRSLIKICFRSLVRSLDGFDYSIIVVADRLSDGMTNFFEAFENVTMVHGEFGNDASLRKCVEIALTLPDEDWVYFVEDDYLHTPDAFRWIDDLIVHKNEYISRKNLMSRHLRFIKTRLDNKPIAIHPPDYPDRYLSRYLSFSLLFVSRLCHWRQVTNTTFTFLMQALSVKRYKEILLYSCHGADDGFLSRNLFGGLYFGDKMLCLSPIPGVASHMHEEVMTPLVDWAQIVDQYRGE